MPKERVEEVRAKVKEALNHVGYEENTEERIAVRKSDLKILLDLFDDYVKKGQVTFDRESLVETRDSLQNIINEAILLPSDDS